MGRILWTCLLALLLAACGSEEPNTEKRGAGDPGVSLLKAETRRVQSPDVTDKRVAALARGNNAFAFAMYREQAGDGNLIFSPYSVSLAFSMAYAGARGETEAGMAETLNFLPQGAQHPAFNAIESRMSGLGEEGGGDRSPPFRLDVASSAWGQEGLRFERAYLETLAGQYGAGMRPVDFGQPDKASGRINAWVGDETGGRIRNLITPEVVSRDTRLVLANAVYFKASWLSSFEERKTKDGPFTLPDGDAVTVPLMRQRSYLPYAEGEGYQAVGLPYRGGAADMLVVLPEEGRFGEVEDRLGAGFLEGVEENVRPNEFVELTMPRYDFESSLDLIPLLQSMGMKAPSIPGPRISAA